jgi:hypothetical protein
MKITDEDRRDFTLAGTVRWDPISVTLVWTWQQTVPTGYVVYLMLIDGDVKKDGIAKDTATSTFKKRMRSEFASVRQVIVGPIPGKPLPGWRQRPLDPGKTNAPPALLAGHTVELWAKCYPTPQLMDSEETRLNIKYRGEWTKEGWTRDGQRLSSRYACSLCSLRLNGRVLR